MANSKEAKQKITAILKERKILFCTEYKFHPFRLWRFDWAIVDKKIAIEFEGGTFTHGGHTRGFGFRKDCDKYNMAQLMGWKVFRVESRHLSSKGQYGGYFETLINIITGKEDGQWDRMAHFGRSIKKKTAKLK